MHNLHLSWFDLVTVAVLVVGFTRGRKNGMSEELLICLQWICLIFACAFLYKPFGDFLTSSSPISALTCYIIAYIVLAGAVKVIFTVIKKSTGGKPISADQFGRCEYYFGMIAGCVRFACMLIAVLALLNARKYTDAELAATRKRDLDVYGESYFPTLASTQKEVFGNSLVGELVKRRLGFLLITPTHLDPKGLGDRREAPSGF